MKKTNTGPEPNSVLQIDPEIRFCGITESITSLRLEYARKLAMYELELYGRNRKTPTANEAQTKVRKYSMSTPNKRRFIMSVCLAKMNGEYILVGDTRKLLGVSRAAMDAMVNDCEEAKWINVKRNSQNYRRIQATQLTLDTWFGYAEYVTQTSLKYGLGDLYVAREALKDLLDTK